MLLGLLGILGGFAGARSWPIIRYLLQPPVQLSDPENKRHKLSRTDAVKALWIELKHLRQDLRAAWSADYGFRQKIRRTLYSFSVKHRQTLHPRETTIDPRFGILAILTFIIFAVLGILVPFLLADGLQGEAIAAAKGSVALRSDNRFNIHADSMMRSRVNEDFKTCYLNRESWGRSAYCQDLRKNLPSYQMDNMNPADPIFAKAPYRFVSEKGKMTFNPVRLSRNTSLQDIGFNSKSDGKHLLHELICVPASLEQYIFKANESFNLKVEDLIPDFGPIRNSVFHNSMIIKTSNANGSGLEIWESVSREGRGLGPHTRPIINHSDRGATWYQSAVDATLPWIEYKGIVDSATLSRSTLAQQALYNLNGFRLENYLITFKPGELHAASAVPIDDPIYGAHHPTYGRTSKVYVPDYEVSALACAELFRSCSENQCLELPRGSAIFENWLNLN